MLAKALRRIEAAGTELTDELKKAVAAIEKADRNADRLYDYAKCLEIGDVWIHLEALAQKIKEFATTNYKESSILCPILGLNMRCPSPVAR